MTDELPRQVFQIKDLPTKSVTLYPSRAHVVRELRDVVLRPGQNEIELFGLTADTDENSVQIDGKGDATITDMTLELLPNNENFSDIYPSESESEDESDEEYTDSDDDIDSVKALSQKISELNIQIDMAAERQKSAEGRLKTLDTYCNSVACVTKDSKSPQDMANMLKMYGEERQLLFKSNAEAGIELKRLKKSKARLEAEKDIAGKDEAKRKTKELKEKEKAREKARRAKQEKRKEANRTKLEKQKFWPHRVYKVTLGLETSLDTPSSSRRNSIDSITLSGNMAADAKGKAATSITSSERTVTLSLSYVTNSAFWTPRYDLSISSPQRTATIVYRAEFSNGTSETWKDAKIILSTSQTSYSGLDDKAPTMTSWQVKLGKAWDNNTGGLLSSAETKGPRYQHAILQQQSKQNYVNKSAPNWNNSNTFGFGSANNTNAGFGQMQSQPAASSPFANNSMRQSGSLFGASNANSIPPPPPAAAPAPVGGSALFGAAPSHNDKEMVKNKRISSKPAGGLFGSMRRRELDSSSDMLALEDEDASSEATPAEGGVIDTSGLDFEESVWEDSGLTANYELPGIRTLAPSSIARRHKIASLTATNIQLSHVCVPKLRSAAFLRAKIRNPSTSVTLLKGTAGVTLDGSFLGNMTLPRVSPSQVFSLPLGVDPAVQISYPKPNVHRSTQGIFNKESAHTFNRSIWLTNTKPTPVELLVIDQVPVSQDERLRMDILHPRGLSKEGDSVKAGQAAKEGGKEVAPSGSVKEGAWGKATATLKKNGEVNWSVNLEKGMACLLKLEYEARMPSGESIVEV